jgi:hypothetical protein
MRAFDYGSISDVVLTLRYTSLDGGDKLRNIVSGVVGDYMKTVLDAGAPQGAGLFTFFDLRADFATGAGGRKCGFQARGKHWSVGGDCICG